MGTAGQLKAMYEAMLNKLGPSHWWPGETPFEICVGAILTQNTTWTNVEKAISALKSAGVLDPKSLYALPPDRLAELIRPAGFLNVKTKRLRNYLTFLQREANWEFASLEAWDDRTLRESLLGINGIGQETADSMMLYAFGRPVFVVDAYTARIMARHGLIPEETSYFELQALFMDALPEDVAMFNEYHALLVRVGKDWCKKKNPRCETCPLKDFLD